MSLPVSVHMKMSMTIQYNLEVSPVFEEMPLGSDKEYPCEVLMMKKDYLAGKGDMQFIINMVPFSPVYEEDRFQEVLGKIIEKEDLQRFKAFSNEPPSKEKKY
ncbi:hypothetical protein QTP88_029504 [Uroleucon formosanum]